MAKENAIKNSQKRAIEAEIGQLVKTAALETAGVHSLKRNVKTVLNDNETISSDVYLIVEYGVKIPAVAWDVQEHVKERVEAATPYAVASVNISVQGVHIPKD